MAIAASTCLGCAVTFDSCSVGLGFGVSSLGVDGVRSLLEHGDGSVTLISGLSAAEVLEDTSVVEAVIEETALGRSGITFVAFGVCSTFVCVVSGFSTRFSSTLV